MKTAIIHDWLDSLGGAEQVLAQMLECFPEADIFTLVDFLPIDKRRFLADKNVTTSFIQKLPGAKNYFRYYLPLMPMAINRFDLSQYDLVLSSSWAFAKGVRTTPQQLHVSYVYTPIRYAWDLKSTYLRSGSDSKPIRWLMSKALNRLKDWDISTASYGDSLIATSNFIARRIKKYWHRSSQVINPPVAVNDFQCNAVKDDFYIIVSRLVHYKEVDKLVLAFNSMPDKNLVVIGDGPMFSQLKKLAGPNVELLGYQPRQVVIDYMQKARAFVFAALEDFGIVLVEAQAAGTPVIAYGRGGVLDSVTPVGQTNPTGLFFEEQNLESIVAAVKQFEALETKIKPEDCAANAQRFSPDIFRKKLMGVVKQAIDSRGY